jgi:hypothetical protein
MNDITAIIVICTIQAIAIIVLGIAVMRLQRQVQQFHKALGVRPHLRLLGTMGSAKHE